jgi:DNA-binding MarR family transcriptional regulator
MSELAIMTSSSQSRLSHAVARLEEGGWVSRARCGENHRAVHATLTGTCYQLVVAAAPGHVREVRRLLFDHLSRQQLHELITITATALTVLSGEGFDVPPHPKADGR